MWLLTGGLALGLGVVLGPARVRWLILALLPATLVTGSALVPFEGRYVPAAAVMGALIVADRLAPQAMVARIRDLPRSLSVILAVYVAWSVITTAFSTNVPVSVVYTGGLALSLTAVFLVVAQRADDSLRHDVAIVCVAIALAMILSGWILALAGGVEIFERHVGLYFMEELTLLGMPIGLVFPQNYGPFVGPSTEPLAFATAAGIYLQSRAHGRRRVFWGGAALICFAALFTTFSREGMMMAAVGCTAVVAYQLARRSADRVSVAIASLTAATFVASMAGGVGVIGRLDLTEQWYGKEGVAILLNPDYVHRGEVPGPIPGSPGTGSGSGGPGSGGGGITDPGVPTTIDLKSDSSFQARLTLWRASLDATMDRPLVGYGLGTVAEAIAPYLTGEDARLRGVTPHSGFLRVAVELGVPGFLIQVAISLLAAWLAITAVFVRASGPRALIAGILAGILAHEVFGTILFGGFSFGNFVFALAVGLLAMHGREAEPSAKTA